MDSVPLTNFVAELHQFLDCFLVGMVLLPVLEADGVEDEVTVNMFAVDMSCHYNFIFVEGFLRELHRYLVSELGVNLIPTRETLHQMIVQSTVRFMVQVLGCGHFVECSFWRAVDSGHEPLVL